MKAIAAAFAEIGRVMRATRGNRAGRRADRARLEMTHRRVMPDGTREPVRYRYEAA